MTRKELERATYVNESKKKRKEKASEGRRDWVGCRSVVYKDRKKYDRKKFKKVLDNDD